MTKKKIINLSYKILSFFFPRKDKIILSLDLFGEKKVSAGGQ